MGVFIQIEVNAAGLDATAAQQIVSACPVEIFAVDDDRLLVRPEREDECTLCELCLDLAPAGSLVIRKLYRDEQLGSVDISRGGVPSFRQTKCQHGLISRGGGA